MSFKVFLPQDLVDAWVTTDMADLGGESLTFRSNGLVLRLVPGFYFDHVSAGTDDGHGLLGKVKTKAAMAAIGADAYMNSMIVGETAYDVEIGFVAKPTDPSVGHTTLTEALNTAGY
jgi:hypothetical protein